MELNTFWLSLRRRWYLVIVAVLLAVGATYAMIGRVGPSYAAEGTVLLFPPEQSTTTDGQLVASGNPYLELGGLTPARDILIRTLTSKSSRLDIAAQFPRAGYEVMSDYTNSGPILLFEVSGSTNAEAIGALNALIKRVPSTLLEMQAKLRIPATTFITSKELTIDPSADIVHKHQIRAGIVAGGGTLAIMLLGIGLIDGLLSPRRRQTATLKSVDAAGPEPETPRARPAGRPTERTGERQVASGGRPRRRRRQASMTGAPPGTSEDDGGWEEGSANPLRKV